jgi:hypothetical protein
VAEVILVDVLLANEKASAAIRYVDEKRPVTVRRDDDVDVGRKLHFTLRVSRRLVEIDDDAVMRVGRIERKVRPPLNPFVLASQPERLPAEVIGA